MNEKEILVVLAQDPHPSLIRLYATFKDRDRLYFLMESAMGGELFTTLRVRKKLDSREARFYAAAVVSAFDHIHRRCIVFRDLKPENVLLDNKGYLKMADFGFAKYIPEGRTWTVCGTPHYLAPEIIHGKGHGLGVDWCVRAGTRAHAWTGSSPVCGNSLSHRCRCPPNTTPRYSLCLPHNTGGAWVS